MELDELSRLTKSDVLRFYKFNLRRCGIERRNLVLSVGPDPILNRIEGTECANFNSESVLALQIR